MRTFDRKFGDDFLPGVPAEPGVYRFYGPKDALLYVGAEHRVIEDEDQRNLM